MRRCCSFEERLCWLSYLSKNHAQLFRVFSLFSSLSIVPEILCNSIPQSILFKKGIFSQMRKLRGTAPTATYSSRGKTQWLVSIQPKKIPLAHNSKFLPQFSKGENGLQTMQVLKLGFDKVTATEFS